MASITLKNVPDDLRLRLKARAAENSRSLNQEILHCLRAEVSTVRPNDDAARARLRTLRQRQAAEGVWLTDADLRRYKTEGRP